MTISHPTSKSDESLQREAGRFYRVGSLAPAEFIVKRTDHERTVYTIVEPFEYVDHDGATYEVPANSPTDFASIPGFLTWLVPKDGAHTPAAFLHDALIGGCQGRDYFTSRDQDRVSDRHADLMFRQAMKQLGVPWLRRWLMWAAVAVHTLVVKTTCSSDGDATVRKEWGRIVPLASVLLPWTLASSAMQLAVPDVGSRFVLPWYGDRPLLAELFAGGLWIGAGVALGALTFWIILGFKPQAAAAGALAGAAIGFLALPMVASAVGFGIYATLEFGANLIRRLTGQHRRSLAPLRPFPIKPQSP